MSHHNYSNHHGRPSHTGTNSHSGSLYPEQGRTILPPLTIAFPTSDSPVSNPNYITTQRSTPQAVPYEAPYYPPAQQQQQQQQQTHAPYLNYPSFQPLSETRHHGGQTYAGSYDRASPPSNLADPWRPPPLDVPVGGRVQGQAYYQYHADLQTPRTSNDLRSPHSVYSPASSVPQYQSPASPAYPTGHSPSRGAVPAGAAANTPQLSMAMSNVSLDYANPMYRSSRPQPYARAPTAPSPVPYDLPPETQEPTIKKKRKRADARQLEALNRMYARTAFPSTEERQQLARDLDMSARSVQIWFQNKRQASRQGGRNPANSSNSQVTVPLPEDTPPVTRRSPAPPVGHGSLASPVTNYPRGSSAVVSSMGDSYRSRSPLPAMPVMRSGQTPSPPGGRSRAEPRADMDPRSRQWPGRGY